MASLDRVKVLVLGDSGKLRSIFLLQMTANVYVATFYHWFSFNPDLVSVV